MHTSAVDIHPFCSSHINLVIQKSETCEAHHILLVRKDENGTVSHQGVINDALAKDAECETAQ